MPPRKLSEKSPSTDEAGKQHEVADPAPSTAEAAPRSSAEGQQSLEDNKDKDKDKDKSKDEGSAAGEVVFSPDERPPEAQAEAAQGQAASERIERIPLHDIQVSATHRPLNEAKVQELVDSIALAGKGQPGLGLLQYPTVAEDRRTLLFGRHRVEATKRLGWPWVPCRVMALSGLQAELVTIDENLIRAELTVLQRAEQVARRVEILETLGLRRQGGGQPGPDTVSGPTPKSTEEIATKAGVSGRTLQRDARIVRDIPGPPPATHCDRRGGQHHPAASGSRPR